MRQAVIRLLILTLGVIVAGCAPNTSQIVSNSDRLIYGLTLSPSGFDPHIHQSSEIGIVLRQVYDTLVYRSPDTGQFIPGLATAWSISEDFLIYEFRLREGVTFHDGTPFNAQAVAATLDRITDPETRSQNALFLLGPYAGYEIVDDNTIRIRLSEPFSPLLDSLSQFYLGIASPTALETYPIERYQFHQIGTGPFTFVEYIPDTRVVIRRNPNYWGGPDFYQTPENGIQEIEFRFFTDESTRLTAVESGDVDIMGEIPPLDASTLTGNNLYTLVRAPIGGQPDQFLINTNRFPTDNVVFRRALLYATNRQIISDRIYQGFSPVAWTPIARNTQFYNRDLGQRYETNVQQARALLASLGYTDADNNGFLDAGEGDIEIILLVPPWGEYREIAQIFAEQWQVIGVKTVLKPVPDFPSLLAEVSDGEYNLVAFNSFGLDPVFLTSYYTSTGTRNFSNFSSPDLDNILFEASRQFAPNVRSELYTRAQTLIMDQALTLPIRDRVNLNLTRAEIQNLAYDRYGWYPILYNVEVVTLE